MDIKYMLIPLEYICEVFSIKSFEIVVQKNKNIFFKKRSKTVLYLIRFVFILFGVITSIIYVEITNPVVKLTGAIPRAVEFLFFNCRTPVMISCLVWTNFKNSDIVNFLNETLKIDTKFKTLTQVISYKKCIQISRVAIIWLILKVIVDITLFVITYDDIDIKSAILQGINTIIPNLYVHIFTLQWIIYLTILKSQFKSLNTYFKRTKAQQFWTTDFEKLFTHISLIKDQDLTYNVLKNSSKLYDNLIQQGDRINSSFAPQILVIVPSLFILVIYNSFSICQMAKGKYPFDIRIIVMDLVNIINLLEIVVSCGIVQEEVSKFVDILNKLEFKNGDIGEMVNTMGLQVYHQKLEFTSFGVFPLDGTLLYSMCGALTTYLVILLQFET